MNSKDTTQPLPEVSLEAKKILEWIEAWPYQGIETFHLACEFRDFKGYGYENPEYESLIYDYIEELKAAKLIYRSMTRGYVTWIASRYQTSNEELNQFTGNGKARSLMQNLRIRSIEELTKFTAKDLMAVRNCGKKTVHVIMEALQREGLALAGGFDKAPVRTCPHCGKLL